MPRLEYRRWDPKPHNERLAEQATAVARRYAADGYDMTVRQLYYQLVAADVIPNTLQSYKHLAGVIDDARMSGMMDWYHIVDRTRNLAGNQHWNSPDEIIRAAARGYAIDHWTDQAVRVEVWVEKEALAGVVDRVARELDVDYFACRGYTSSSEMWRAARRLLGYIENGQRVLILHLGDHDPSGIDMSRDIVDRLHLFTDVDWARDHRNRFDGQDPLDVQHENIVDDMREELGLSHELPLEVRRIALNRDQVDRYQPPPNPAKVTDSRAGKYIELHGTSSWELDALEPTVLAGLIRDEVYAVRDVDLLEARLAIQQQEQDILERTTGRWADVVEFLTQDDGE